MMRTGFRTIATILVLALTMPALADKTVPNAEEVKAQARLAHNAYRKMMLGEKLSVEEIRAATRWQAKPGNWDEYRVRVAVHRDCIDKYAPQIDVANPADFDIELHKICGDPPAFPNQNRDMDKDVAERFGDQFERLFGKEAVSGTNAPRNEEVGEPNEAPKKGKEPQGLKRD